MPLDYSLIKNWPFPEVRQVYSAKDSMLYGLAIGFGHLPSDERQLRFVYERGLLAVPTMACVLGYPGPWLRDKKAGLNWVRLVHGEHDLRVFKPLPPTGEIIARNRVIALVDKGRDKGALIVIQRDICDAQTGELLSSQWQNTFARGDGGFGEGDSSPPVLPAAPDAPPDIVCDLPTSPNQALLYRLCSDFNPLHADPAVAQQAGFQRPILHGLATYGFGCHAILKSCLDYDPTLLKRYAARFTAPVFPGEKLRTSIWKRGNRVHFRTCAVERDTVVLDKGIAEIG